MTLRAIAAVLPPVAFFWQVVGASAAFSPVSRGGGSGLISGLISLGFVGLVVGSKKASGPRPQASGLSEASAPEPSPALGPEA